MIQVFAKRHRSRNVEPGERLAVWMTLTFDQIEPPTLQEMLDAHPLLHTEDELVAEVYQAIRHGWLSPRYSPTDQDTVYVPGPRLR